MAKSNQTKVVASLFATSMFAEPSWDVEDSVSIISKDISPTFKTKKIIAIKKKTNEKDVAKKNIPLTEHIVKKKKSKNKYKALNEKQKTLKIGVEKSLEQIPSKKRIPSKRLTSPKKLTLLKRQKKILKLTNQNLKLKKKSKVCQEDNDSYEKPVPVSNANEISKGKIIQNEKESGKCMKDLKKTEKLKRKHNGKESKIDTKIIKKARLDVSINNNNKKFSYNSNTKIKKNVFKGKNIKTQKQNDLKIGPKVEEKSVKKEQKTNFLNKKLKNSQIDVNGHKLDRFKLLHLLRDASSSKETYKKVQPKPQADDEETNVVRSYSSNGGRGDETAHGKASKGKNLKERMLSKLESARFRYLNERLYTTSSHDAVKLFHDDPDAFQTYHQGFNNQVEKWSVNPVDLMINYINSRPPTLKVADFGCGDAKLAAGIRNQEVHSFDLVACNPRVTVADIREVPLATGSMDVVVFCLSLMGTNLNEYLAEANRVLKMQGILLIAEVVSRFEKIGLFIKKLNKLGFYLLSKNDSNKMFIWFELRKMELVGKKEKLVDVTLAPCIYKKR